MNAERIEIDGEHLTAALTAEIMKRPKLGFVAPSSAKNSSWSISLPFLPVIKNGILASKFYILLKWITGQFWIRFSG